MPKTDKQSALQKIILKLVPQKFELLQASQSSVEIRRGPKTVDLTVKAYANTIEEASVMASKAYKKLTKDFPE